MKLSKTYLSFFAICMLGACSTPNGLHKNGVPGQLQIEPRQKIAVPNQVDTYFLEGGLAYEAENFDKAEVLLRKAAVLGHYKAEFILGTMYEDGKSVSQSNALADEWYQKSADQGYVKAQARLRILKKSTGN